MRSLFLHLFFTLSLFLLSHSQSPIRGQWTSMAIANTMTFLPVKITDSLISTDYNGDITYSYKLNGNRITTTLSSAVDKGLNKNPSFGDLKNCFSKFYSYELKGDMIQIKSQDGKLMAQMRKTGDVAADSHPIVTSAAVSNPIPVPTPSPITVPITTVPFLDPGILKNKWKVNVIKGIPVIFPVEITSTNINFQFCNKQSLPFSIGDNNSIKIDNRLVSTNTCEHLYPQEVDVVKAFAEATSFDVNSYFLYLKKGADIMVFLERVQ